MTDTSSLPITHATTDPYPVTAPLGSPAANGAISDSVAPDEEEPYTIKCICSFDDDDGNTVFCERCETWQHIICYYPDKKVPDVHNCVDCEPRPLDSRRAVERQRQRRIQEQSEDGDRKTKRPGAKSQKKKSKETDVNGFGHQRSESGARDQPPTKKAKTSHRSSASIGSTPALPSEPRKRGSSASIAMSPTKSSGPLIPLYSNEFLHLHDRDGERVEMDTNLFLNVSLLGDTALWVKSPEALAHVAPGRRAEDIFTWSDAALDRYHWPSLMTETITDPGVEINGRHPTWKIVKTRDAVHKDQIVGELTGKVGLYRDYCLNPNNRYAELRHPEPFVFFSSQLPLCIDSRHEGSMLRYVRRSCRSNVTLKIFITNDVEYHFCFVAKEDIPADSEITTMWYLDTQVSDSSNGLVKQESGDSATEAAAVCISNALANLGGCACGSPQSCLLANLDRRQHPKALDPAAKPANGKRKKAKSKSAASPMDTGHASTSRAGSETTKHADDDDPAADSRSTSGSARGQPRSRDLSPAVPPSHDLGVELSSRERRKIADAEKQFQQLEQDRRATTQRKKKRASATSAQSTPAAVGNPSQTGYFGSHRGSGKSLQLDVATGVRSPTALSPGSLPVGRQASPRKTSASGTPIAPSPLGQNAYTNATVQADTHEGEELSTPDASKRRRRNFHPVTARLLKRCSVDQFPPEEAARQRLSSAGSDSVAPPSPALLQSPIASNDRPGVAMTDAGSSQNPPLSGQSDVEMQDASSPQSGRDSSKPLIPPPWPSTAAHNTRIPGSGRGDLRVSMPPPSVPAMPHSNSPGSASTASVASPTTYDVSPHSTAQTPTPTPVKKKLSLGDYLIRRGSMATTPGSERAQANSTSPAQRSPSTSGNGPTASAEAQTPPKAASDADKNEPSGSPDVTMKDAPESAAHPHVPSISS